jgi:hypothetical protein
MFSTWQCYCAWPGASGLQGHGVCKMEIGRLGERVSERPQGGPHARRSSLAGTTTRVVLPHWDTHGGGGAGLPAHWREQPHDDEGGVNRMAAGN